MILGKCGRLVTQGLLAASFFANGGCLGFLNPVSPLPSEQVEPCFLVPRACKDHVYLFFMSGLDVLNCGNLTGVRNYVNKLGFHKTYHGQLVDAPWFDREIRRLHHEDADARFVLIGYGAGNAMIRSVGKAVHTDGVTIDLLVYLDGDALTLHLAEPPANVRRVVNLQASFWKTETTSLEGAENSTVAGVSHFGLPSHPYTLGTLLLELSAVAAGVPFTEAEAPVLQPSPEDAPTPRPLSKRMPVTPEEWDFIKPVSRLKSPARQGT